MLKSGKRSCCGRGGAWFKKCGDGGDAKFDHTWAEGVWGCQDYFVGFHAQTKRAYQAHGTETINVHKNERGTTTSSVTVDDIEDIPDSTCPDELTVVIGFTSFLMNVMIVYM